MGKSNEIRVLLVRTGQTQWEQAGRIAGSSDVPLSPEGQESARQAAIELGEVRLGTIFCGTDEASNATAQELAKATGAKVKPIDALDEVHLGLWEGLRESELEEKCPKAYRQWIEDPAAVQVPEGESMEDARGRIMDGLCRVLDKAKTDNGATGVVLRPVALALVGCELSGAPTRNLWSMMKTGPALQWRTFQRGMLKQTRQMVRQQARAGT
jgi:broad specificity phosphatase PhoE